MTEEWKPVVGYEGLYEVSNKGRVRSIDRLRKGKHQNMCRMQGKMLKPIIQNGYLIVSLVKDAKCRHYRVHRLVAEAFIPNDDLEKSHVNHIDGDKTNNSVENLEWCTYRENAIHAIRTGLWHSTKGKTINQAAPNSCQRYKPSEIELIMSGSYTANELAELLGRTVYSINHIRSEYKRKEQTGENT